MSSLTPAQEALRALAEKATEGLWEVDKDFRIAVNAPECAVAKCYGLLVADAIANAAYIAEANPAAVLALLDELAAAREALAEISIQGRIVKARAIARARLATPADEDRK